MNFSSDVGKAINAANGDCGWGIEGPKTDPSSGDCTGQYVYGNPEAGIYTIVIEGIYWASASFIGGLYTNASANTHKSEWLMVTPDNDMPVIPTNVKNAKSLEGGNPALYKLISDTTSAGHAWLPAIMPDGTYTGLDPTKCGKKILLEIYMKTDNNGDENKIVVKRKKKNGKGWVNKKIVEEENFLSNQWTKIERCLKKNKCYQVKITDSAKNGICCEDGEGSVRIVWDGDNVSDTKFFNGKNKKVKVNCNN